MNASKKSLLVFVSHCLLTLLFLLVACAIGIFGFLIQYHIIDLSSYHPLKSALPSIIVDVHGIEWARFQLDRRTPLAIKHIPKQVIDAFIAAEDWSFFNHSGISIKGIIRSILVNIYNGRAVQGASTITQQLVKLIFADLKKTVSRKIKEQIIAIALEFQYTKEQILQAYLNNIYFGCGIYGVQAASQRFWSCDVTHLSVAQAATLAGIVRSPAHNCPLTCPLSAKRIRNVVLAKMHRLGMIGAQEKEQASNELLGLTNVDFRQCAPHLKETIRLIVEPLVGKKKLYQAGLTIKTTLDKSLQEKAEHHFTHHISSLRTSINPNIDGALLTMEVQTGAIRAVVGGLDFKTSQFNRLYARRQIGSTFKPLLYATALYKNIRFDEVEIDEPITLHLAHSAWSPKNHDGTFAGPMTLAHALAFSNNIVTIKLLLRCGPEALIGAAGKAGIKGPFHTYPSLALGCIDAPIKEVAGMFNLFANHGVFVEPYFIESVTNHQGKKLFKHHKNPIVVLEPFVSDQVARVLQTSIRRLYNRASVDLAHRPNCEVISKTGTTNNSSTCWFIGSTPDMTTAVYIGNDDNSSLGKNVYPVKTAFPLWVMVNQELIPEHTTFTYDPRLKELWINRWTGIATHPNSKDCLPILVEK